MTQPASWNNGTITGTFLNDDFTPFVGSAIIKAGVSSIRVYGQANVSIGDKTVALANGAFTQTMPASSDPDISNNDWTYTVTIVGPANAKSKYPVFSFKLAVGATVDLSQVTVVAPSAGLPNIVGGGGGGGPSGPVDISAVTGVTDYSKSLIGAATSGADTLSRIGGTSLALGATSSTAKAGDYQPAAANISDANTFSRAILTAVTDAASMRTKAGMTSVGSAVAVSGDQPAAQSAIGLGAVLASIATLNTAVTTAPAMLMDSGGSYTLPADAATRPLIFVGATNPGGSLDPAKDIWLSTP